MALYFFFYLSSVQATSEQDVRFGLTSGAAVVWGEAEDTQIKSVVVSKLLAVVPGATFVDVSAPDAPVFR